MNRIANNAASAKRDRGTRYEQIQSRTVHQDSEVIVCPMTFQCYLPRSSERAVIGAVFVTTDGSRRLIPDHCLAEVKLCEQGRLLRLVYTSCAVEVAGQRPEGLFEDAIVGRLGTILQPPPGSAARDQVWVSSPVAIVPATADSRLDRR